MLYLLVAKLLVVLTALSTGQASAETPTCYVLNNGYWKLPSKYFSIQVSQTVHF